MEYSSESDVMVKGVALMYEAGAASAAILLTSEGVVTKTVINDCSLSHYYYTIKRQ